MANYERGVYEPSDEVRVFDGSEEEDDVEGSRLPLLIVLALLVLAMFAGVVWLAYTQGVARGRGETPVLTAANGPERVAPQSGGDGTVPYQGFKIYEQPAPLDDTADNAPAGKTDTKGPANAAPAATPAAPPKPAPVAEALKPAPAPFAVAPKPAPPVAAKPVTPPLAPVKAAATPAPKPTAPAAAPPKSVAALIQQANSTPVPAAAKPAPAKAATTPPPAMKQAVIPPAATGTATGAPRSLVAPTAAPSTAAETPAPKPATAAPASGGIVLQIGAYKSRADADAAWKTYKAKHSALLSGYSDDIQQADLGEKGTWYRLRIGGMSNREVAAGLCDRLKADGGACILGK
jgi:hypothetical protein